MLLQDVLKDRSASADMSAVSRYDTVRGLTEQLCCPLVTEDYGVQSMPEVSPTKWHLAHTSWFFETFLLKPHANGYVEFDPHFGYLFNSYYNAIGDRHCRQNRGQVSRPRHMISRGKPMLTDASRAAKASPIFLLTFTKLAGLSPNVPQNCSDRLE